MKPRRIKIYPFIYFPYHPSCTISQWSGVYPIMQWARDGYLNSFNRWTVNCTANVHRRTYVLENIQSMSKWTVMLWGNVSVLHVWVYILSKEKFKRPNHVIKVQPRPPHCSVTLLPWCRVCCLSGLLRFARHRGKSWIVLLSLLSTSFPQTE